MQLQLLLRNFLGTAPWLWVGLIANARRLRRARERDSLLSQQQMIEEQLAAARASRPQASSAQAFAPSASAWNVMQGAARAPSRVEVLRREIEEEKAKHAQILGRISAAKHEVPKVTDAHIESLKTSIERFQQNGAPPKLSYASDQLDQLLTQANSVNDELEAHHPAHRRAATQLGCRDASHDYGAAHPRSRSVTPSQPNEPQHGRRGGRHSDGLRPHDGYYPKDGMRLDVSPRHGRHRDYRTGRSHTNGGGADILVCTVGVVVGTVVYDRGRVEEANGDVWCTAYNTALVKVSYTSRFLGCPVLLFRLPSPSTEVSRRRAYSPITDRGKHRERDRYGGKHKHSYDKSPRSGRKHRSPRRGSPRRSESMRGRRRDESTSPSSDGSGYDDRQGRRESGGGRDIRGRSSLQHAAQQVMGPGAGGAGYGYSAAPFSGVGASPYGMNMGMMQGPVPPWLQTQMSSQQMAMMQQEVENAKLQVRGGGVQGMLWEEGVGCWVLGVGRRASRTPWQEVPAQVWAEY